MRTLNMNFDPSQLPSWILGGLLLATFAAELLDHIPRAGTIDLHDCLLVCDGRVQAWSPDHCACHSEEAP